MPKLKNGGCKILATEEVLIGDLKPHPRNYRKHPEDQIKHLIQSITEHGIYRNVIIAKDGTILAGHGVVKAILAMGGSKVSAIRVDIDPEDPRALKLMAGDNEISHLGEVDDRQLSELLREIKELDPTGLEGTGYDEMMLANLIFVTSPADEIGELDESKEWEEAGMPEFDHEDKTAYRQIAIHFEGEKDVMAFQKLLGQNITADTKSLWYPAQVKMDSEAKRYVDAEE